jgi:glycosyltransferase involved in cell wall biosynthesis
MKKVGILLGAEPHAGGVFQYNQSLLEAVAALAKEDVSVVVGYTSDLWSHYLQPYGFKKVLIPRGILGRVLGRVWRRLDLPIWLWRNICSRFDIMSRAMLREHCDLWIYPSEDPSGYQVPAPALVSIHDLMHRYERHFPEVSANGEFLRRDRNYRNICRWARGVLVDSEVGLQQLQESYELSPDRIHVLPYIAPRYMAEGQPESLVTTKYRLPPKYLFYPAQFWEHKNHQRLLHAVAKLKHSHPDIKLVLAGSAKNGFETIRQLVCDLGLSEEVKFLGYVPDEDMAAIYRVARALIMPTFFGPTNIPPLEAFVAGCPVAISGIYGMPEQAGDAALFFDPLSIDEMAVCIERLWTDDALCSTLAIRGRERAARYGQQQFNERFRNTVMQIILPSGTRK